MKKIYEAKVVELLSLVARISTRLASLLLHWGLGVSEAGPVRRYSVMLLPDWAPSY